MKKYSVVGFEPCTTIQAGFRIPTKCLNVRIDDCDLHEKQSRRLNSTLGITMIQFEEASRPVIFECDDPDYSYWGKGSSFLIANSTNYYWVTAAHVLANAGAPTHAVRIFPSDCSRISLPFNEKYVVNKGVCDDEDHKDIFVLRVDLGRFDVSGDAPLIAQDIESGMLSASQLKPDDELWVIGYPAEHNLVDYDSNSIKTTRYVLRAVYRGESPMAHCHELQMVTSVNLESYDGLSGSPVYHMKRVYEDGLEIVYPLLVGMLLRGTASSYTAHFVTSDVLSDIIKLAEAMPNPYSTGPARKASQAGEFKRLNPPI